MPLHSRKGFDDVETVALALYALLLLATVTALPVVLPKLTWLPPACRAALTPPAPNGGLLPAALCRLSSVISLPSQPWAPPWNQPRRVSSPWHVRGELWPPSCPGWGVLAGAQGLILGRTGHCRGWQQLLGVCVCTQCKKSWWFVFMDVMRTGNCFRLSRALI